MHGLVFNLSSLQICSVIFLTLQFFSIAKPGCSVSLIVSCDREAEGSWLTWLFGVLDGFLWSRSRGVVVDLAVRCPWWFFVVEGPRGRG